MESKPSTPMPQQMEIYRQQMMEMYHSAISPQTPFIPQAENWLDARYPIPDIIRDRETVALENHIDSSQPSSEDKPSTFPVSENTFVGYLRVFTFTGDTAEPIVGARVIVSKDDVLYANIKTDRDGYTPIIPLPSIDPALTLQPGFSQPYVAYTIQVHAEGFTPMRHENVPVYGNNYVTQPVALLPLLWDGDPNTEQNFISGGPANL